MDTHNLHPNNRRRSQLRHRRRPTSNIIMSSHSASVSQEAEPLSPTSPPGERNDSIVADELPYNLPRVLPHLSGARAEEKRSYNPAEPLLHAADTEWNLGVQQFAMAGDQTSVRLAMARFASSIAATVGRRSSSSPGSTGAPGAPDDAETTMAIAPGSLVLPDCLPSSSTAQRNSALARRFLFVYGLLEMGLLEDSASTSEPTKNILPPPDELLLRAIGLDADFLQPYLELALLFAETPSFTEGASLDRAKQIGLRAVQRGLLQHPLQRPAVFFPELKSRPFWSLADLDRPTANWIQDLEQTGFKLIRAELCQLLKQPKTVKRDCYKAVGGHHRVGGRDDGKVLGKGDWREVVLFSEDSEAAKAARTHFSKTVEYLRKLIPEHVRMAESGFGEIIISRLAEKSHIKAHCAPNNTRLTVHLGLDVPAGVVVPVGAQGESKQTAENEQKAKQELDLPQCRIRVGEEWRGWQTGKCLVFDDSFEHEVVNDAALSRTVLLIRFWHPGVRVDNGSKKADISDRSRFHNKVQSNRAAAASSDPIGPIVEDEHYEPDEPLFIVPDVSAANSEDTDHNTSSIPPTTTHPYLTPDYCVKTDDLRFNLDRFCKMLPPTANVVLDRELFEFSMGCGRWEGFKGEEDFLSKCRHCGRQPMDSKLCNPQMVAHPKLPLLGYVYKCCPEWKKALGDWMRWPAEESDSSAARGEGKGMIADSAAGGGGQDAEKGKAGGKAGEDGHYDGKPEDVIRKVD